jgi:hypothetical protein
LLIYGLWLRYGNVNLRCGNDTGLCGHSGKLFKSQGAIPCVQTPKQIKGEDMKKGEKLVIVGCSGSGGPAAMRSRQLMPDIDITVIRMEDFFIVR